MNKTIDMQKTVITKNIFLKFIQECFICSLDSLAFYYLMKLKTSSTSFGEPKKIGLR